MLVMALAPVMTTMTINSLPLPVHSSLEGMSGLVGVCVDSHSLSEGGLGF